MAAPAPANAVPRFGAAPLLGQAVIATANTARTGKGAKSLVFTAGPAGCSLEGFRVIATTTTTAGMVRLFLDLNDPKAGTNSGIGSGDGIQLFEEVAVTAATPSGTVKAFTDDVPVPYYPFSLPSNAQVWASTHNAETFVVYAFGSHY